MELTPDQLGAARARGCVLTPATDDQVRRLSMQRRIFSVGGLPFVAARDGFIETHGTLAALIEGHRPAPPEQDAGLEAAPTQEAAATAPQGRPNGTEAPPLALGAPTPAEPEVARTEENGRRAAAAKPRKPRAPRPKSAPTTTDAAPSHETAPEPSAADDLLAAAEAAQGDGPKARVVGRRRAGQPAPPRWAIAGKMRRGRLT